MAPRHTDGRNFAYIGDKPLAQRKRVVMVALDDNLKASLEAYAQTNGFTSVQDAARELMAMGLSSQVDEAIAASIRVKAIAMARDFLQTRTISMLRELVIDLESMNLLVMDGAGRRKKD